MKQIQLKGTIETFAGKTLTPPVNYAGPCDIFETAEEIAAAGETPNPKQIVSLINQQHKAKARQALMSAALLAAGYEKPDLSDDEFAHAQLVKSLLQRKNADGTPKYDAESARVKANETLDTDF